MQPFELALTAAAVFFGAVSQRVTGVGFTLVAAPMLVLVIGPLDGVALCLVLNTVLAVVVLCGSWRHVLWSRAVQMFLGSLLGTFVGAQVIIRMPASALMITVGLMIIVAISLIIGGFQLRFLRGRTGAVITGFLSGSMNVAAGTGGPILVVHSRVDGWPFMPFVGTVQVFFLASNVLALGMRGPLTIGAPVWAFSAVALAVGAVAGHFASRMVKEKTAVLVVTLFAMAGGLATLLRGLMTI